MISVIVTVYNIEKFISKCLESVLSQTYKDLEIIVVDDGSTDSSGDICDKYALYDNRIKVIHKKNEGLVRARKDGLAASKGDYIGYVDGDDWIEPEMYETLFRYVSQYNVDVVTSGRVEEYPEKSKICRNRTKSGLYRKKDYSALMQGLIFSGVFFEFGVFPTVWDKLFRRDVLFDAQMMVPDEIVVGEDVACSFPCIWSSDAVYVTDEIMYHYRKRQDSMLRQRDERYNLRVYKLQEYLFERAKETEYFNILKPQIDAYIMDMILNGASLEYNYCFATNLCHQYIFPFDEIKKNQNIVIYGAGAVGQTYFKQIKATGFCNIVGWLDSKADTWSDFYYKLMLPSEIKSIDYDLIVIAVLDKHIADEMSANMQQYGVKGEKIFWKSPIM